MLSDLLDLQEVDIEIDRLLHARQSLPALEDYRRAHEEREEAAREARRLRDELRVLDLELDKGQGELDILEAKLDQTETRLFAGGMSSRETEHMRLEVQSLRGQREALEEKILGLLDQRDELAAAVAEAEERLEEIAARERRLEEEIAAAWKEIDAKLARLETRKAEMITPIPDDLLELYEELRRHKEGVAIGRLEHGVCGGCHLTLSPSEQAEAARSDPPRCVHCRRILVL